MKRLIQLLVVLVYLTLSSEVNGQSPLYFTVAGDELAGIHIYDLIYTEKEALYIATNQGLYRYTNKQLVHYEPAEGQFGRSVYSLVQRSGEEVYAINLTGQILRFKEGRSEVFCTIPKKYLNNRVVLKILDDSTLIVGANGLVQIDIPTAEIKELYPAQTAIGRIISISEPTNGRMIGLKQWEIGNYLEIKRDTAVMLSSNFREVEVHPVRLPFQLAEKDYFIDFTSGFWDLKEGRQVHALDKFDLCRQTDTNEFFVMKVTGGAKRITIVNGEFLEDEVFFPELFVSAVEKNEDGTVFLGTFGEGVKMITNWGLRKPFSDKFDRKITCITGGDNGEFFFGTTNGNMYHYQNQIRKFDTVRNHVIDRVLWMKGADFKLSGEFPELLYPKNRSNGGFGGNFFSSYMDVDRFTQNRFLIANNRGLLLLGDVSSLSKRWGPPWKVNYLSYFGSLRDKVRGMAVRYDQLNKDIYLATNLGLYVIDSTFNEKEIKINNHSMVVTDIDIWNDTLYMGTSENGVLIFHKRSLIRKIGKEHGLISKHIRQLKAHDNHLFIATDKAFQIYNLSQRTWKNIGTAEGVVNGTVEDFVIDGQELWLISHGTALKMNWKKLVPQLPNPKIYLDSIMLFDRKLSFAEGILFDHDANHFTFHFGYRNIKYADEVQIYYRLKGFDKSWQSPDASTKEAKYKSLPPGEYTFSLLAVCRGQFSEAKTYSFTIDVPFYQKWWFYLCSVGLVGLVVSFFFVIQIRRIRKKSNDRLEKQVMLTNMLDSRLSTLRSQMNPHFIFNSLNSIQALVLRQDVEKSYDYLVVFSELVRKTLLYSEKDFINLEDEIDFLEIYLSLESLRMKEDFSYDIHQNGWTDIKVPSLMIQPFVENAIHHGLLHKKGKKTLKIEFEFDERLICTITDNGIGREEAAKIKERQQREHLSFSLRATKERIEIFQQQYNEVFGYEIIDLYKGDQAVGTKVILSLPVKRTN